MKRGKKSYRPFWVSACFLAFTLACSDRDEVTITPAVEIQTIDIPRPIPPPVIQRSRPSRLASEEVLAGVGEVRASLTRADYNAAVEALLALRSGSKEGQKYTEYLALHAEVAETLRARMRNDEKAAQSLARLNQATQSKRVGPGLR